ncbi:HD domain-containing protein [candidate division KSB1 bacterium]|nr:HD domain-containing protein [candidate division KSB1 bacterium]
MISDLSPGQSVSAEFVVRTCEIRSRRENGELYLHLELGDASGRISGSLWNDVQSAFERCGVGKCVRVEGKAILWKGRHHLAIARLETIDDPQTTSWIADAPIDPSLLYERILALIDSVDIPPLRTLLQRLFGDETFRRRFLAAPAGKLWHHCSKGGLAQHTWAVTELALDIAKFYPNLQKNLLIAGALLHDVGKIREYRSERFIDYSDEGRLLGHVAMGYGLVAAQIQSIADFPPRLRQALLHLILSHHGDREAGAPVLPMTPEALVLHFADRIDSLLNAAERIRRRDCVPGRHWSRYIRLLDRFLYFDDLAFDGRSGQSPTVSDHSIQQEE